MENAIIDLTEPDVVRYLHDSFWNALRPIPTWTGFDYSTEMEMLPEWLLNSGAYMH